MPFRLQNYSSINNNLSLKTIIMCELSLNDYINEQCQLVDAALDSLLPAEDESPETIHQAMRYSIFAGGKRMRPVLCLAAAEACDGLAVNALVPACAVEMMHTYSLIHDDLPAMDNDDLRRGKPTSHKVYGEGIAILAGDALLTEAFAVIAQVDDTERYTVRDYVKELAATGGSKMLIGGQVLDLEGEKKGLTAPDIRAVYEGKTAALLTASLRLGAMSANATEAQLEAITEFGYNLGLAFQIIDDILDLTASTEELGKTAGKDLDAQKSTYPALVGIEQARTEAKLRTQAAMDALQAFTPEKRARLEEIADYLLNRKY